MGRREFLSFVLILAAAASNSATTPPHPPTPSYPITPSFDGSLSAVCEQASHVVIGTIVDTTYVAGDPPVTIWTEYHVEVDTFIVGEPTRDSTLVFRAPGGTIGHRGLVVTHGFRPSIGTRYLLYLAPCYSGHLKLLHSGLMAQVSDGWVTTPSPVSSMPLDEMLDILEQKLAIRSPIGQRDQSDLVAAGVIVDLDLTWVGDNGTLRFVPDSILVNHSEYVAASGETLIVQVEPLSETMRTFTIGEEAVLFLSVTPADSLQLKPSIWSKWSRDGSDAVVVGHDTCAGKPAPLHKSPWSDLIAKISR